MANPALLVGLLSSAGILNKFGPKIAERMVMRASEVDSPETVANRTLMGNQLAKESMARFKPTKR